MLLLPLLALDSSVSRRTGGRDQLPLCSEVNRTFQAPISLQLPKFFLTLVSPSRIGTQLTCLACQQSPRRLSLFTPPRPLSKSIVMTWHGLASTSKRTSSTLSSVFSGFRCARIEHKFTYFSTSFFTSCQVKKDVSSFSVNFTPLCPPNQLS
jgi:hypothetical protein